MPVRKAVISIPAALTILGTKEALVIPGIASQMQLDIALLQVHP